MDVHLNAVPLSSSVLLQRLGEQLVEAAQHGARVVDEPSGDHGIVVQLQAESGWLLLVYVLATSKVISGRVPTCDSAQSWRLYNTAPLGDQAVSIMA